MRNPKLYERISAVKWKLSKWGDENIPLSESQSFREIWKDLFQLETDMFTFSDEGVVYFMLEIDIDDVAAIVKQWSERITFPQRKDYEEIEVAELVHAIARHARQVAGLSEYETTMILFKIISEFSQKQHDWTYYLDELAPDITLALQDMEKEIITKDMPALREKALIAGIFGTPTTQSNDNHD